MSSENPKQENSKSTVVTETKLIKLANALTNAATSGIQTKGFISKFFDGFMSSHGLAAEYLCKDSYKSNSDRIHDLIMYESLKSGGVGFLTGLGGFLTLPIALPADMVGVWCLQARMVGAIAEINGYSIKDSSVQTGILLCLIGSDISAAVRNCGVKVTTRITEALIKKIPGEILIEINKKVGFRLLTKAGEKGIINLSKMVPVFGGVFSGTFDTLSTKVVGECAQRFFAPKRSRRKKRK